MFICLERDRHSFLQDMHRLKVPDYMKGNFRVNQQNVAKSSEVERNELKTFQIKDEAKYTNQTLLLLNAVDRACLVDQESKIRECA
jgi:hypothetical protein